MYATPFLGVNPTRLVSMESHLTFFGDYGTIPLNPTIVFPELDGIEDSIQSSKITSIVVI
jgi:hypothetical protein